MWIQILCVIFIPLVNCLPFDLSKVTGEISRDLAGDKYIFVGDDLRLTCSPSEKQLDKYNISNVSFSFSNLKSGSNSECLPAYLVHVNQDEKSATLVVHNVTRDDAGQYTCHIGKQPCQREPLSQLTTVGLDDVDVEYPPKNVNQFICVFYNWNDFVNCTWQHPVDYVNWSNINMSAAYTVSSKDLTVSASRCLQLSTHSCTLKSYLVEHFVMEVNVTNILKNITASNNFPVNGWKSVKPAPVTNLSAQDLSGCISLSWKHSKPYPKVYRIRHQIVGDNNFVVVSYNTTDTQFKRCSYRSYTHYNFTVDSYPADIYSGYWSDPVYIHAWTPMTAPNVGPATINGSYTFTKCVDGYRNVTLMWQEIEESDRNGIIDSYLIKLGEKHLKNVSADVYLTVVELSCNSLSELTIYAHNKGGYSVKPSALVISKDTFSVPKSITESFVVEISANSSFKYQESLRAIWNMTEDARSLNYTIFWCLGQPGVKCEGPINWSEVPGSRMYYDLPQLDVEAPKYLYGISVRDIHTGTASGIFWTGCLFRHHSSSAGLKLKNVYVENGIEYVRVTWNLVQCSYQNQVKVSGYLVKWCQEFQCNDTNRVQHENVPATESSYTISPLTAPVNYKITVQPVVDGHAGEEFQPWKVASPRIADGQNLWWLYTTISITVIVVVVGFTGWTGRKCVSSRNRLRKYTDEPVITFPPGNNQNDSPRMNPANSVDPLMPEAPDIPAVHYRTNNETALIVSHEGISGEATSANTSGESFADDPSNNSRTRLIKPTPQKENQSQQLPQVPDYVALNNIYVPVGGAPTSKSSSQESDNADVHETLLSEEVSFKDGWSSPSLTTGTESVQNYIHFTEVQDEQAGLNDICVQEGPGTQIPGQMPFQTDHIVLCLEQINQAARLSPADKCSNMNVEDFSVGDNIQEIQSNQAARLSPAEKCSNMNVEDFSVGDSIQEIQTPDDTVTNVESTAPSVIGAQSPVVDFGNGSSDRGNFGNWTRFNLGNSGSGRTSSGLTDSEVSFEIVEGRSSGQITSPSSSESKGYVGHHEV